MIIYIQHNSDFISIEGTLFHIIIIAIWPYVNSKLDWGITNTIISILIVRCPVTEPKLMILWYPYGTSCGITLFSIIYRITECIQTTNYLHALRYSYSLLRGSADLELLCYFYLYNGVY